MLPWRFQSRGVVHTPKAESPSSLSYLPCTSACCPLLPHPAFQPLSMSWQGHQPPMGPLFPSHSLGPLGASCSPQSEHTQSWVLTLTHTHSCTRACTGTHALYTSTCTYTHAHTRTHTHTSAPTGIEICVQIHTHTLCTYTPMLQSPRRSTLTHTLIPTQAHGHTHLHMDPCTLTHTQIHTHTPMHAHVHVHTHIGTHVSSSHRRFNADNHGWSGQAELDRCLPCYPGGYCKGKNAAG